MSVKKNNTVVRALTWALIILMLVGVVGFFALFTNGFKSGLRTFYINYGGDTYTVNRTELTLPYDSDLQFDIRRLDGKASVEDAYTVRIIPGVTEKTDFIYTVDGEEHRFSEIDDLTAAFDVTQNGSTVTLNLPRSITVAEVLETVYPGQSVSVPDGLDTATAAYFAFYVATEDGKSEMELTFRTAERPVENVTFEQKGVIF